MRSESRLVSVSGPHGSRVLVDQDLVRQRIIFGQDIRFKGISLVFDLPQVQVGIIGGFQIVFRHSPGLILVQGFLRLLDLGAILPYIAGEIRTRAYPLSTAGTHTLAPAGTHARIAAAHHAG
jgi:hypothetical protein